MHDNHARKARLDIKVNAKNLFAEHPYIDIQPILIMFNKGSFSGATLEKFAGKRYPGSKVIEWYERKIISQFRAILKMRQIGFLSYINF